MALKNGLLPGEFVCSVPKDVYFVAREDGKKSLIFCTPVAADLIKEIAGHDAFGGSSVEKETLRRIAAQIASRY